MADRWFATLANLQHICGFCNKDFFIEENGSYGCDHPEQQNVEYIDGIPYRTCNRMNPNCPLSYGYDGDLMEVDLKKLNEDRPKELGEFVPV